MLLGQIKLNEKLNNITIDDCPRSTILLGPEGCGKHTFLQDLSNKLGLHVVDITDTLDMETIDNIYLKVEPSIYFINCKKISLKEQNVILKFLEEPLKNAYIFLLCENRANLISTILNRCQIWTFEGYPEDLLEKFIPESIITYKDYALNLAETPGQMQSLANINIIEIFESAYKIITKIGTASIPNTLTLTDKLGFKQEKDKIDPKLLTKALFCIVKEQINNNTDNNLIKAFDCLLNYSKLQQTPNIDQKYIFDNFIINLWSIMRGE